MTVWNLLVLTWDLERCSCVGHKMFTFLCHICKYGTIIYGHTGISQTTFSTFPIRVLGTRPVYHVKMATAVSLSWQRAC